MGGLTVIQYLFFIYKVLSTSFFPVAHTYLCNVSRNFHSFIIGWTRSLTSYGILVSSLWHLNNSELIFANPKYGMRIFCFRCTGQNRSYKFSFWKHWVSRFKIFIRLIIFAICIVYFLGFSWYVVFLFYLSIKFSYITDVNYLNHLK